MANLINKDALVAEIEKLIKKNDAYDKPSHIADVCYNEILSFLNTLEVKEVDLEKEIDDYTNSNFSECYDGVLLSDASSMELTLLDVAPMARYFFELGLNAKG